MDTAIGMVMFTVANLALAGLALAWARRLVAGGPSLLLVIVTLINFVAGAHFVVLSLGLLGRLTAPNACGLVLVCAGGSALYCLRRKRPFADRPGGAAPRVPARPQTVFQHTCIGLLIASATLWVIDKCVAGTWLKMDDLTYHAAVSAAWVQQGTLALPPFTYQTYFPFGAELLSIWFMLPFGDATYTSLAVLLWAMLAALCVAGAAIGTGAGSAAAALAAALFLISSVIRATANTFAANDIAGASLVMAAVALLADANRDPRGVRRSTSAYVGLTLGMAVGTKVTFALPALIVLVWWFLSYRRRGTSSGFVHDAALCFGLLAIAGGYWYLRNWALTGNPLYPAQVGPLSGPLGMEEQIRTKAWTWISRGEVPVGQWMRFLDWPHLLAALVATGYLAALGRGLRVLAREGIDMTARDVRPLLFLLGAATLLVFPFQPFSGTFNEPYATVVLRPRFIALTIVCGLVLSAHLVDMEGRWGWGAKALALIAFASALTSVPTVKAVLIVFVGGAGALVIGRYREALRPRVNLICGAAIGMTCVALACWYPVKQRLSDEIVFQVRGAEQPIGRAWERLEQLPAGSKIAFFMSDPFDYTAFFPMFGRRLQLRPVAVGADGGLQRPLHERAADERRGWWDEWVEDEQGWIRKTPDVSAQDLVHNLRQAGADYVLTSKWSQGRLPPQDPLISASGRARLVYTDGYSNLWRLD